MKKPRLRCTRGIWVCRIPGTKYFGIGLTMENAYHDFLKWAQPEKVSKSGDRDGPESSKVTL